MPTTTSTILDQISAEKTKISERLARLDADREKIATQLTDLETAERVLTRVGKTPPGRRLRSASAAEAKTAIATRGRGRPPRAAESKSAGRKPSAQSSGLGERVLALATGKTRQELYAACPSDRPNHVGIAVQRHIRVGSFPGGERECTISVAHTGVFINGRPAGIGSKRPCRCGLLSSNVGRDACSSRTWSPCPFRRPSGACHRPGSRGGSPGSAGCANGCSPK